MSLSSDASAGHWPPRPAPDSEVGGTVLAEWVEVRKFSTTRLRPGYDQEEVDVFLTAIRDSFLGVRQPSLRPDEIRGKQFSTTRLRPGYDEEEVDAFLDEAELRMAAQGSDLDTGKAQDGEPELDADSPPVQDQPTTSRTYLIATACLVGGLVSVGLAATEIAEYAHHNWVGSLAILGMIIGALAGLTTVAVNEEKPPGWARRINTVAAWLALIGFFWLLFFFMGQHGVVLKGGLCKTFLEEVKSDCGSERCLKGLQRSTIVHLPGDPRMLSAHPNRPVALLQLRGLVQHHDRLRIAQVREDEPLQRGQRRRPVPGVIGAGLSSGLIRRGSRARTQRTGPGRSSRSQTALTRHERTATDLESVWGTAVAHDRLASDRVTK